MKPADQRSRRTKWTLKCLLLINGFRLCRRRKTFFFHLIKFWQFSWRPFWNKSRLIKREKKRCCTLNFLFWLLFFESFCDVVTNRFNVIPVGDSKRGGLIRDARKVAQRPREWEKFFSFPNTIAPPLKIRTQPHIHTQPTICFLKSQSTLVN